MKATPRRVLTLCFFCGSLVILITIMCRIHIHISLADETDAFETRRNMAITNSYGNRPLIAVGLKTGRETLHARVPMQLLTFLNGHDAFLLLGDAPGHAVGTVPMHDILANAYEEAERAVNTSGGLMERPFGNGKVPVDLEPSGGSRLARRGTVADPTKDMVKSGQDEWSGGWILDAHKNLPGLKLLFKSFPHADWFLMIDDDTHVFLHNLQHSLSKIDANKPHYFGQMNRFKGCDGVGEYGLGPNFAQGGTGIVLSRGAMERVMEIIDDCTVRYRECWAGDIRVGLCLRDAGIPITPFPGFHGLPPTKDFVFPTDPCEVPHTFHHALPLQMQMLYETDLAARPGPSSMADFYARFQPRSGVYPDTDRPGADFATGKLGNAQDCEDKCLELPRRVSGGSCWTNEWCAP
ncbi:hypothetical protein BC830DRAFT_1089778 [Chytriomyces sp. MP71]|nr:hypothetical protein BC830DRAFT_1089778 [Chytriomyces sp. MP71]